MRRTLKKYLPDPETIRSNPWLRPFAGSLLHPRLWHLNRHSAAGAVAAAGAADALAGALGMGNAKDVLRNRPTDTERKREFYRLGCFVVMALSWPSASALIQNS